MGPLDAPRLLHELLQQVTEGTVAKVVEQSTLRKIGDRNQPIPNTNSEHLTPTNHDADLIPLVSTARHLQHEVVHEDPRQVHHPHTVLEPGVLCPWIHVNTCPELLD